MHYIQKHILDELRTVDAMHYAALNRDEIESGHFRYHLRQLIKDGYISQEKRGLYQLTPAGERYVDSLSEHRVNAMKMPKVITYTLLKDNEKLILQEKRKQPYIHLLNMVGGKLHEGETAQRASVREVKEKTGREIAPPSLAGIFEVLAYTKEAVFTHAVAYTFIANVTSTDFDLPTMTVVDAREIESLPNLAPDFLPIYTRLQSTGDPVVEMIRVEVEP